MLQGRIVKKDDEEEIVESERKQTRRHGDAVPIRTPYLMSMLIKLSGLCGIILLFMVIGTAHTNNILVEENVLVQMNREETIRMNRLNLNQDPKSIMSDQHSLEPGTLAAYSDALVKKISDSLPTSMWSYSTNSTETEFKTRRFRGSVDDNLDNTGFEIPPWLLNPWNPSSSSSVVTEALYNDDDDDLEGGIH